MNLIVFDNFLQYPDIIRTWALQQEYYNCQEMSEKLGEKTEWPGVRTIGANELDNHFANLVLPRISYLSQMCFGLSSNLHIRSAFQITRKEDGNSWIHTDHDVDVAFLLYLTPNAPVDSGTILYTPPPHQECDKVGNIYNRLVMYRSNIYHKSNMYFGDTLENGRLTFVGFIKVENE